MRKIFIFIIIIAFLLPNMASAEKYRAKGWWHMGLDFIIGVPSYYSYDGRLAIGFPPPYGFGIGTGIEIFGWVGNESATRLCPLSIYYVPYTKWKKHRSFGWFASSIIYSYLSISPWGIEIKGPDAETLEQGRGNCIRLGIGVIRCVPLFGIGLEAGFSSLSYEGKGWNYETYTTSKSSPYIGVNLSILSTYCGFGVKEVLSPYLFATINFSDVKGNENGILESGEKGELVVRALNKGEGTGGTKVRIFMPDPELRQAVEIGKKEISTGKIKPGRGKIIRIPIRAKNNIPTGRYKIICTSTSHKEGHYFKAETWITTKQSVPPYLVFEVTPFDDNEDRFFDAGEMVGFRVNIKNSGRGEAYKVKAYIQNPLGTILKAKSLGSIKPAETKKVLLKFQMPLNTKDGTIDFRIGLEEASGYAPEDKIVPVNTRALKAVVFEEDIAIDDDQIGSSKGDGEGDVDKGEIIELVANIRNRGTSVARGVKTNLLIAQRGIELLSPEAKLGNINPEENKEAILVFTVKKDFAEDKITPKLIISEGTGRFTKQIDLEFEIGKPARVAFPPRPPTFKRPNTFIMVIGINRYENKAIQSLSFAENDAMDFYNVMIEYGGIEHTGSDYLLLGKDATYRNIITRLAEIENMVNKSRDSSYVYIFFSGHGGGCLSENDKRGPYLLPYDVDRTNEVSFQTTSLSVSELKETISRMKAKVFVAVNACYSTAPEGVAALGVRPLTPLIPPNGVIISAADFDQMAYEHKKYRHSIFAYRLLEILKGKKDENRNGWIEVGEIFKWVDEKVNSDAKDLKRITQNPKIWPKKNYANFEVTKVRR